MTTLTVKPTTTRPALSTVKDYLRMVADLDLIPFPLGFILGAIIFTITPEPFTLSFYESLIVTGAVTGLVALIVQRVVRNILRKAQERKYLPSILEEYDAPHFPNSPHHDEKEDK